MSLVLYYHPLASYCWKALIALYENGTPFEGRIIDLSDPAQAEELAKLWPVRKFPVLRDNARNWTAPESSIIIEYLDQYYPGPTKLVPSDPDQARQARMNDRFFDFYVMDQMSKIVTDKIRPPGKNDPHGVEQARTMLATALDTVDRTMAARQHPVGDSFTMADCAAAPALFYADKVMPLSDGHPHAASYLRRLMERPSFARVLKEAEPYFAMFPG